MANKLSHWGCWRYLSLGSLEVPLWIVSCFIESILWRVRYLSPPRFLSFDDFPKPLCIATKKMIPRATPAGPNWFPTGPVRRREHNFHRRDSGLPCSCYTPNLRVPSHIVPWPRPGIRACCGIAELGSPGEIPESHGSREYLLETSRNHDLYQQLRVSIKRGSPKSSIYRWDFPLGKNHPFLGYSHLWKPPIIDLCGRLFPLKCHGCLDHRTQGLHT